MALYLSKSIKIPLGKTGESTQMLCRLVGLNEKQIRNVVLYKQSVDARDKSNVHFVCSFLFECDKPFVRNATPFALPVDALQNVPKTTCKQNVVVVGSGPSGLFAALYLCLAGHDVTVVEKGMDIDGRKKAVQEFFDGGKFDKNTNVQFGLGGAGTFSDGKLTTGISSPLTRSVFCEFVRNGAPQDIMYSALPHIGTDKLSVVVANMRDKIIRTGGKFLFETSVTDFVIQNGVCKGVIAERNGDTIRLVADKTLLCCGHSARDIFAKLVERGVETKFKPFAVGVRVEHKRSFIDKNQYGLFATHRDLSAASYKLAHNGTKRSCYSFCMCPGGVVVAANSEPDSVVVNGMSKYARDDQNSNSALVVTVNADDMEAWGYGTDSLCGMRFQIDLERKAYALGGGDYVAPCQSVADFAGTQPLQNDEVVASYPRGVKSVNLRELLPAEICDEILDGLTDFDRKIDGFARCGVITGVETRTSSPVKICRNDSFESSLFGLFPVGEGAGYAGGIVSAAVDGLRVAISLCKAD